MDLFSQIEKVTITEKSLLETGFQHFQEDVNRKFNQFVMIKGELWVWKTKSGQIVYDNDALTKGRGPAYIKVTYMDELPNLE